jgi:stage IV sporulation protein FB
MFAAKIRKFEVGDVELNFFGGKASILDFPVYKDEFYITISGPLVSLLLFVIGYIPFYLLGQDQYNLLLFMVAINLVMFIFNMLPILPMDGGKVLRSILCKWFNYLDATRICVILSKILCIVLAIISLLYLSFWMIIAIIYIWVSINGEMENAKIYQNWFDGVDDEQES